MSSIINEWGWPVTYFAARPLGVLYNAQAMHKITIVAYINVRFWGLYTIPRFSIECRDIHIAGNK